MTRAAEIRQLMKDGDVWTVGEIRRGLGLEGCPLGEYQRLKQSVLTLHRRGDLVRVGNGRYCLGTGKVPAASHVKATDAQQRMWLCARNLPQFCPGDIERLTGEPAAVVLDYIMSLETRGAVRCVGEIDGRQFYQVVQDQVAAPAGNMPPWAEEARELFEETIDLLCAGNTLEAELKYARLGIILTGRIADGLCSTSEDRGDTSDMDQGVDRRFWALSDMSTNVLGDLTDAVYAEIEEVKAERKRLESQIAKAQAEIHRLYDRKHALQDRQINLMERFLSLGKEYAARVKAEINDINSGGD
jgi:FtsZ-binding cell division protein ZapB